MEFFEKLKNLINYNKFNLIGGVVLLGIVLFLNFGIYKICDEKITNMNTKNYMSTSLEKEEVEEGKEEYYKIDIKGAVNKPGVYKLVNGSRIIDAINVAGGLIETADTSVNNLSKRIKDEMVIVIYTKDEVLNFNAIKEQVIIQNQECVNNNDVIQNESCIEQEDIVASEVDLKISINKADIDLLMTIPGIGESKAKSIINYREEKGLFKDITDIMNVSGIGEALFEKIKDYITV